jgi:hypothetical protein
LPPFDLWREPLRDREHTSSRVEANYGAPVSNPCGGCAGEDPSAAGDVENPVARLNLGGIDQSRRPFLEKRRHEKFLVRCRARYESLQVMFIH